MEISGGSSVSTSVASPIGKLDLICLSHLRWDFVTQRPQHLMRRAADDRRVFFWEEPIWHERGATESVEKGADAYLEVVQKSASLWVSPATPLLWR